jgi:sigma-E factor negative regulatory protein RseC
MIEEQAQVVEVHGNRLLLKVQRKSTCGSCSAAKGCGTSLLSGVFGRKVSCFHADNNVNASAGDTVIVALDENALLTGSVMMYMVPLIVMFVFSLTANYLLAPAVQYRDLLVALAAVAGLLSGAYLSGRYFSSRPGINRHTPVVLRKVIASRS